MIRLDKILACQCCHVISFKLEKCFANFHCTASNNILDFHNMNSRFLFIKTKVLQICCKVFRDITKYSNNYRNNLKFILWVHNLEVTYQKPINIDIIVDFLHNVNVSSATKFNNSAQLIRLFQITRSGLLYGILVAVLIEIFHQFSLQIYIHLNHAISRQNDSLL